MTPLLTHNEYGESRVRLLRLTHGSESNEIRELTVDICIQGEYTDAYTNGANTAVLPTNTMKNTVYALARNHSLTSIELFARLLAKHFLDGNSNAQKTVVSISEKAWAHMGVSFGGSKQPHPTSFIGGTTERQTCRWEATRSFDHCLSGIEDLLIMKTKDSGFSKFKSDPLTTLQDSDDRILGISLRATWWCGSAEVDHDTMRAGIRETMLNMFAFHKSLSAQHTLYALGEAVVKQYKEVEEINLVMSCKQYLSAHLELLGLHNDNSVFIPADEPLELIEGTIRRSS